MAAATLRDVARRAGVSVRTVSNVVNGYVPVSDAVRTRVMAAVEELGYRPNLVARNLRSGRSQLLALVVPEIDVAVLRRAGPGDHRGRRRARVPRDDRPDRRRSGPRAGDAGRRVPGDAVRRPAVQPDQPRPRGAARADPHHPRRTARRAHLRRQLRPHRDRQRRGRHRRHPAPARPGPPPDRRDRRPAVRHRRDRATAEHRPPARAPTRRARRGPGADRPDQALPPVRGRPGDGAPALPRPAAGRGVLLQRPACTGRDGPRWTPA